MPWKTAGLLPLTVIVDEVDAQDGHTSLQAGDGVSDLNALDGWYDVEGNESLEEALRQALEEPKQPVPTYDPSHCHSRSLTKPL